jgi:hypothetical protein
VRGRFRRFELGSNRGPLRASKCSYAAQFMTDGSKYPQLRSRIHFVIVDLRSVAPGQEALASLYYPWLHPDDPSDQCRGYMVHDRAGGTASTRGDAGNLQRLLDSVH